MHKAKTTIQERLKVKREEKKSLDDLMGRWSSCMRLAYKRLVGGLGLSEGVPKNYRAFLQVADESPQRESGRADGSTDGRNPSAPRRPKGASYNLWRVLRVAVLTALSPDSLKVPRCGSPLKPLLVSGDVGRTLEGREVLIPGAGPMGAQMPPAGFMGTLKRRGINSPAPELCKIA